MKMIALFLCLCLMCVVTPQHVFDNANFCTYNMGGKQISIPTQYVKVSSGRRDIYISPCNVPINVNKCNRKASVCFISKRKGVDTISNAGDDFIAVTQNNDDSFLQTTGGGRCKSNPSKNYTTKIVFQCSDNVQVAKLTQDEDEECEFEITMIKPGCAIKCTTSLNSNFIDLRFFKSKTYKVTDEKSHKQLSFSLCGASADCGQTYSACEIKDDTIIPLGDLDRQHLLYYEKDHSLIVRSRHKESRRVMEVDVVLKCNWDVEMSPPRFTYNQGRKFKIEIVSKHGCVKAPMNCVVPSIFGEYFYDLNSLNRANDWVVSNYSGGSMTLNICGPLKSPSGDCKTTNAQVCAVKQGLQDNHGSIFGGFTEKFDNTLTATFLFGTTCRTNNTKLLSTIIHLKCSSAESGPVFNDTHECVTSIFWETPAACPTYVSKISQGCVITDFLGLRNLSLLHTRTDRVHTLSQNSYLRYNFCGNLTSPCDGNANVSVCLVKNRKEFAVGFTGGDMNSINGIITSYLHGNSCNNNKRSEVNITYNCDYYAHQEGVLSAQIIEDNCKYKIQVKTPVACPPYKRIDCRILNETHSIDLTPLMLGTQNYVVKDIYDRNISYRINVCRSVLFDSDSLCIQNTGICMKNASEPNILQRFKSLGLTESPKLINGQVVINANNGNYCDGGAEYSSEIVFECSQQNEQPVLVSRKDCTFSYKWRTKHACPKKKPIKQRSLEKCSLRNDETEIEINLSTIKRRTVLVETDYKNYTFDLCSDNYTICVHENCTKSTAPRKLFFAKNGSYIDFRLEENCLNLIKSNILRVHLICFSTKPNVTFSSLECDYKIEPENLCVEEGVIKNDVNKNETVQTNVETTKIQLVELTTQKGAGLSLIKCTGVPDFAGIQPLKVVSSNETVYDININDVSSCNGKVCDGLFRFYLDKCPLQEYSQGLLKLTYTSTNLCSSDQHYLLVYLLKCKSVVEVISESKCGVTIELPASELCVSSESKPQTTAIVGSTVGIVLLLLAIGIGFYFGRRKMTCIVTDGYCPLTGVNKSRLHLYERNVLD